MQDPLRNTSILIFSPHPDDESLGTAGLIQKTLQAGGTVHVVFMTNGDAFRVGVASYYKIIQVKPQDYIHYGEMRQGEALKALATMGLPPSDVTFLGYADRGLMGMWEINWLPSNPWTSYYSHASVNPYPNAPSYGLAYCGVNVLSDVEKQILADKPTDIYVTHPTDDHPDHSASASFVFTAVKALETRGPVWITHIHLHYFLIHRGDWPVPQGYYPSLSYGPPSAFLGLDSQWQTLALSPHNENTKKLALDKYVSQEEMMQRFLSSFIRKNELYADLPESQERAADDDGTDYGLTADENTWPTETPVAQDPVADSVLRDFQPGGDIKAIYAATKDKTIYIKIVMQSELSPEIGYRFTARPFDEKMTTIPNVINVRFSPRTLAEGVSKQMPDGVTVSWSGKTAEFDVPMNKLGIADTSLLFVEGTTTFSRVTVDHTGYRPVFLPSRVVSPPLS
jgi:LmbE family N-acetylglucosaminyl deacetylase